MFSVCQAGSLFKALKYMVLSAGLLSGRMMFGEQNGRQASFADCPLACPIAFDFWQGIVYVRQTPMVKAVQAGWGQRNASREIVGGHESQPQRRQESDHRVLARHAHATFYCRGCFVFRETDRMTQGFADLVCSYSNDVSVGFPINPLTNFTMTQEAKQRRSHDVRLCLAAGATAMSLDGGDWHCL